MQLEPQEDKRQEFRFSRGGYPCPYCHSRTGWSYLRNYGKEYGVCFACNAKNYPFSNGKERRRFNAVTTCHKTSGKSIPLQVVERTLRVYQANPFVAFLEETLGRAITSRVVSHFKIGTARNGGTVFWYFDKQGFCRKPKVVFYDSNGHRIQDDPGRKPHCAGYTTAKGYTLPLFGEHQLNEQLFPVNTPVVLVESEKTALIGYAFLPQYVWLASGGARSINTTRAAALVNRKVMLLPDADQAGRAGALATLQLLQRLGVAAQIKELFPQRADHTDLADYLILLLQGESASVNYPTLFDRSIPLSHPMPREKIQWIEALFNQHPVLWQLTHQLGLEITDVKAVSKP